jgi:type I restriction enzyme R subunit
MPRGFTERATVQDPLVKYATEVGWSAVSQAEQVTLRKGEAGLFFYQVLRDELIQFNPDVVTESNVDEVIRRMESARASIEGNEDVLLWLRGQRSVYVDRERREINAKVIDFERAERNIFQVTDEWDYTNGRFRNRADVVFLINGIPADLVETKAANKPDGIDQGITQVRRYHRETPEMLTAPQVFDITHLIHFYYGVTWSLDRRSLFNWKDEEPGDFEQKVKHFFDKSASSRCSATTSPSSARTTSSPRSSSASTKPGRSRR